MVTVCTVLPPTERPRVDAVGDGCFATLHADSLRDVLRAAPTRRVDALVISVHRCHGDELPTAAGFLRTRASSPGCVCSTPAICSSTPASPWRTWPTGSTALRPRASAGT